MSEENMEQSDSDEVLDWFSSLSSGESDFEGFSEDDIPLPATNRPTFSMMQSQSDRENALDVEYWWSREDSPPTVAPFTGAVENLAWI